MKTAPAVPPGLFYMAANLGCVLTYEKGKAWWFTHTMRGGREASYSAASARSALRLYERLSGETLPDAVHALAQLADANIEEASKP